MNNSPQILFKYLPLRLSQAVHSTPKEIFNSINEVRLRKNMPLSLTLGDRNIFIKENGNVCQISKGITVTEGEINECVSRLTEGSFYSFDEYISAGFIPLPEGGRAGVCGKANYRNGKAQGFSEILSVNLRLHRFLPNAAKTLAEHYLKNGITGTLVCSPPGLGKTTFLRSITHLLACGSILPPTRVAVADERLEILAGMPNAGIIDSLLGMPKAEAITLLTRTMSPQVIICDEISPAEVESVLESQSTGVSFIASAHCKSPKDLQNRGRMRLLTQAGIFPLCVILGYEQGYTCEIFETEKLL